MPGGDQTGPMGMGPMSGRGMGYCAGNPAPGFMNPGPLWGMGRGWGRGFGMGRGRGRRFGYYATGLPGWVRFGVTGINMAPINANPPAPEQEVAMLKTQAEQLETALKGIKERIEQLSAIENG